MKRIVSLAAVARPGRRHRVLGRRLRRLEQRDRRDSVKVTAKEFSFKLSRKSAPHGKVTFKVTNKGSLKHDFKIAGKKTQAARPQQERDAHRHAQEGQEVHLHLHRARPRGRGHEGHLQGDLGLCELEQGDTSPSCDRPGGELARRRARGSGRAGPPRGRCSRRPCATAAAATEGASGRRRARSPRPRGTRSRARRLELEAVRATRPRCGRGRSARRRRRGATSRPQASFGASARACSSSSRADLGRDHHQMAALHRRLDVGRVPEVGGEVLPAAVGEDRRRRRPRRARRRACARRGRPRRRRRRRRCPPRSSSARSAGDRLRVRDEHLAVELRRRRGSAARSRPRASAGPSPGRPAAARRRRRRRPGTSRAGARRRPSACRPCRGRRRARRRGRAPRRSPRPCPRSGRAGSPRSRTGTA